ncbi:PREDICTED: histidine-containing phosphotransfer protein 4-like, partial [Nicotiana attenuata]|uniref:histidine-containing phosphotransfer protein 4-like n=1 Tax=Nicotiana attenuata TaxID=49451 RepID=UPI000904DF02
FVSKDATATPSCLHEEKPFRSDEQFIQLEELQDDANPNFVEEVVNLFFTDSARFIRNIELALANGPYDFNKLDDMMHQFKGSSSR